MYLDKLKSPVEHQRLVLKVRHTGSKICRSLYEDPKVSTNQSVRVGRDLCANHNSH